MSLKSKAIILVAVVSFIFTAAFTTIFYLIQKDMVLKQIDEKLKIAAFAINEILPSTYHDRAVAKDAISEDEYNFYLFKLTEYSRKVDVYYLYSFVIQNGRKFFTSTSMTEKEYRSNSYDRYFTEYIDNPHTTKAVSTITDPIIFEEQDKYGYFRSIYIPMFTKSGSKYYLAADIDISEVISKLNNALFTCISVGVILFILTIFFGVLIASKISKPILKLSEYAENIIENKFNNKLQSEDLLKDIISRKDEIGNLTNSFKIMEQRIEHYIRDIMETTAAKEKIESELKIAHDIQNGFLPKQEDYSSSYLLDIYAEMHPAKDVGGDLYDYFISDGKLFFIIGDVSGKGVPAALFMSTTITLFRAFASSSKLPSEILYKINNEIFIFNDSMTFVTLIAGIYDMGTGEMFYSNAGHTQPYIVKNIKNVEKFPIPDGLVSGILKDFEYIDYKMNILSGDTLIFYTDGITEAFSKGDELFGDERFSNLLKELDFTNSKMIVKSIVNKIFNFSSGRELADDMTVLAIRRI